MSLRYFQICFNQLLQNTRLFTWKQNNYFFRAFYLLFDPRSKKVFFCSVGGGLHDCASLENFRGLNTAEGEVQSSTEMPCCETQTQSLCSTTNLSIYMWTYIYRYVCTCMHANICTGACSLLPCSGDNFITGRSNCEALILHQLATQVHVLGDVWSFAVALLAFSHLSPKPLKKRDAVTILFWSEEQRQPSCHPSPVTSADHSEAQ